MKNCRHVFAITVSWGQMGPGRVPKGPGVTFSARLGQPWAGQFNFLEPIWAWYLSDFVKTYPPCLLKKTRWKINREQELLNLKHVSPILLPIFSLLSITVMFESRNNSPIWSDVLALFLYKLPAYSSICLQINFNINMNKQFFADDQSSRDWCCHRKYIFSSVSRMV